MKKIIFYISFIISVILLINISQILIYDFDKLTQYGFGYLIGKIILLVIFVVLILITKSSISKTKEIK